MLLYRAIATDFDGTLATDGQVEETTWRAIALFRERGGKVILVTGREFEDLQQVCPQLGQFDAVIAENGGIIYWPDSHTLQLQGSLPPQGFVQRLQQAGISPIQLGRVIVATWQPHGERVAAILTDMQLDYQVILNKNAVMVLPKGVDKASSLIQVFASLSIAPGDAVGIGDAENDTALLQCCGLGVAVDNALPALKETADYVTVRDRGRGVQELIQKLLNNELAKL